MVIREFENIYFNDTAILLALFRQYLHSFKGIKSPLDIESAREELNSFIENVIEYNDSITVSTKNGNAVIISEAEYNAMLETIYLVSQKGLAEKIKKGEKEDISKMSTYNPNEEW